jgi:hypothetical protein
LSDSGLLGKPSQTPEVLRKPEPQKVLGLKLKDGEIYFPADHKPGIKVPKGGSSCKTCEYLKDASKRICGSPYFIAWNKSGVIPEAIDEYCSDWYTPKKAV